MVTGTIKLSGQFAVTSCYLSNGIEFKFYFDAAGWGWMFPTGNRAKPATWFMSQIGCRPPPDKC
jgi:hypothetical protein